MEAVGPGVTEDRGVGWAEGHTRSQPGPRVPGTRSHLPRDKRRWAGTRTVPAGLTHHTSLDGNQQDGEKMGLLL